MTTKQIQEIKLALKPSTCHNLTAFNAGCQQQTPWSETKHPNELSRVAQT